MSATGHSRSSLSYFRDDFRMSTWMLAGACLHAISILLFGQRALIATGILLAYQIGVGILEDQGIIKTIHRENVRWGKWTVKLPDSGNAVSAKVDAPDKEQIVVFILGSRSNHPRGRFAPGFAKTGRYFEEMWRDLAKNQKTNGFLGKTSTLFATDEICGNSMCWISYWKDIDSLQAFANGPIHKKSMVWYMKMALNESPNVGIMHETYRVPRGYWESISHNMRPFGLSNTKHFIEDKETGEISQAGPGMEAKGKAWEKMRDRMAAQ